MGNKSREQEGRRKSVPTKGRNGKRDEVGKALEEAEATTKDLEAIQNGGMPGVTFTPAKAALSTKQPPEKIVSKQSPAAAAVVAVASAAAEPMTKAGVREYNDFFGLFAKALRENRAFRPLGFIPGPAVILNFREGGEVIRIYA